jgi:DNA-binding response OmpR family regulator
MPHTILLIEQNYTIRRMVARDLEQRGLAVLQAKSVEAAASYLDTHTIDVIVCEVYLPDGAVFHLLADPRLADKPALGLGYDTDTQDAWTQFGKTAFLKKPVPTRLIIDGVLRLFPRDTTA